MFSVVMGKSPTSNIKRTEIATKGVKTEKWELRLMVYSLNQSLVIDSLQESLAWPELTPFIPIAFGIKAMHNNL